MLEQSIHGQDRGDEESETMKTLIDTIREELRERETALRKEADKFYDLGAIESARARAAKADTLNEVCELIVAAQVRERAEREKCCKAECET